MARRLSLRQVEAFKAVMELGTAARAAEVLCVSQPAMSKLIANLEQDTGVRLFDRAGGRLVPTDRARRLFSEIDRIFTGLQQVEHAVDLIRREGEGHLTIGAMPALSGAILQRVLLKFRAERPGVCLTITTISSPVIAERVRRRQIDIALVNADIDDPAIEVEQIARYPLMCILPKAHPLSDRAVVTPADLGDMPMVSFERKNYTGRTINRALDAIGFNPKVVIEATVATTICGFVAAGAGFSLFHPMHVLAVQDEIDVRPFLPEIPFNLVLCRRKDVQNPELVEAFATALRAEISASLDRMSRTRCPPSL